MTTTDSKRRSRTIWGWADVRVGEVWQALDDEVEVVVLYSGDPQWFEHIMSAMLACADDLLAEHPEADMTRLRVNVYRSDMRGANRRFKLSHTASRRDRLEPATNDMAQELRNN